MKLFVKFFSLDEVNNVLEVHSWTGMSWHDAHLTWTPSDYGNVTFLHVSSKDIWLPDFALYDSGDLSQNTAFKRTTCLVYPQGTVLCVPITKWPVHCRPNLRQWPFDSHECTMKIGSWTHVGEMIDITLKDGGVDLDDFQGSREWELKNVTAIKNVATYDCCPNATYPSVTYKFIIKRHASAYAATVTVPSLILTAMTLSSFWLDPEPPHRLAMCSISILCHCLYLQYLGVKLPSNGDMTPVIVLFFRNSIIICVAALVLSVIQLRLSSPLVSPDYGSDSAPLWLTRLLGMALDQEIGRIIFLGRVNSMNPLAKCDVAALIENGTDVNEAHGKIHNEWIILVAVIDHLAFFMVLLTYIVLLIDLIPVD
ncbi:neuronal acetylcholine receptor subunit alpha-2-like [Hetaerina americana]|uniref:neuronal acetylcholine receptor subunit alpha-2-like n=1 Tax=Hetaerina americana TaxID=62018 RepID=UPI003A7F46E8